MQDWCGKCLRQEVVDRPGGPGFMTLADILVNAPDNLVAVNHLRSVLQVGNSTLDRLSLGRAAPKPPDGARGNVHSLPPNGSLTPAFGRQPPMNQVGIERQEDQPSNNLNRVPRSHLRPPIC